MIKIGPAAIGGVNEAEENLKFLEKNKIQAAEVAFTRGIYLKKPDALKIGKIAKKLNIDLSVHAPYYINLNSKEKEKITASKQRIIQSCQIGHYLGAKNIVFHPGFYGKDSIEDTYEKIKEEIQDLEDTRKEHNLKPKLAPETTGKVNVFGDFEQTLQLVKDTKCSFCIDFAHLKARYQGKFSNQDAIKKLKKFKHIHCHYSGINYGEKGEKNHIPIDKKETTELLKALKNLNCTIICEAPDTYGDTIKMNKILEKIKVN